MGRHKKDCKCEKCKIKVKVKCKVKKMKKEKVKKECGCRKRGKRCISPNPCTECIKQNEIEDAKSRIINKKRGRGRPKKVRVEEEVVVVPTFTYKFLGYCPSCKLSLTDSDLVNGKISCQKCGKVLKVSELVKTIELDRPKTKKEYFQSVNSVHTWHDYNASSNISTIAKKEDPMLDEIEDEHIKSDEDEIISKKHIED